MLGLGWLLACSAAWSASDPIVGILQGSAVLIRQSSRLSLAEGASLADGDIVETAKGGFVQIEFADGALVGVGESTRLLVEPRLWGLKPAGPVRVYVLEGWAKVRLPAKPAAGFGVLSPLVELDGKEGSAVVQVQPPAWSMFIEAGSGRALLRNRSRTTLALRRGDFVTLAAGQDKPTVAARVAASFREQLPRPFRDPLPARGDRFAKRTVNLKSLGPVSYDDVSAWLRAESAIRLPLSRQWSGRANDAAFRAAVDAHLSAHPEWERVLYPERFLPKKPPDPATQPAASAPPR